MVYFIDTENVGKAWLNLLDSFKPRDKLVLFYTSFSMAYTLDVVERIRNAKCPIEFVSCTPGHNALDFQLVAELARRAAKSPSTEYAVVSWDRGFSAPVDYLRSKGYLVSRLSLSCKEEPDVVSKKETYVISQVSAISESNEYSKALRGRVPDKNIPDVADILTNMNKIHISQRKIWVNNELQSLYGNKKAGVIYKAIKSLIK